MKPISTALQPGEHTVTVENGVTQLRYVRSNCVEGDTRTITFDEAWWRLPHSSGHSTRDEQHTATCPGCAFCEECGRSACLCERDGCLAVFSGAPVAEADDDTEAY